MNLSPILLSILSLGMTGEDTVKSHHVLEGATVDMAIVSMSDAHIDMELDIDLEEGWKTYYRQVGPGQKNIEITWGPEMLGNVEDYQISWPSHKDISAYGDVFKGYDKDIIIPIRIWLNENTEDIDPVSLSLSFFWCKNLCLREELEFKIPTS